MICKYFFPSLFFDFAQGIFFVCFFMVFFVCLFVLFCFCSERLIFMWPNFLFSFLSLFSFWLLETVRVRTFPLRGNKESLPCRAWKVLYHPQSITVLLYHPQSITVLEDCWRRQPRLGAKVSLVPFQHFLNLNLELWIDPPKG